MRLRWIVQGLLLLLLALLTARLAWQLVTPVGRFGAPAAAATPAGQADPALAARAFSQGGAGASAGATADTSGLALFGVRTGSEPSLSTAIIGSAGGTQGSFAVGDQVAPGVTLVSVGPGHVMLSRSGGAVRLALPDAPANAVVAAPLPALASVPAESAPTLVSAARLVAQTGLRPRLRDGQADGYTVIPRGDGAMFQQAGLQPGDVLLTINGQALTPERIGELDQILQSAASAVVTLERGGERKTLTLQMEPP